jgi:hypothetical protein
MRLNDQGSIPAKVRIFIFATTVSRPALGTTQPHNQYLQGMGVYAFMAWCLRHGNNSTFCAWNIHSKMDVLKLLLNVELSKAFVYFLSILCCAVPVTDIVHSSCSAHHTLSPRDLIIHTQKKVFNS